MKFRLNRKSYAPNKGKATKNLLNDESITEYIRCDNRECNNRDKSNLDVGFTVRGIQIFCHNCFKSILHIELNGELLADTHPQGTFNRQKQEVTDYKLVNFSSRKVLRKKIEEGSYSNFVYKEEDIANVWK